jgi:uncharacterized coiled-coil protein SlyX
MRSIVHTSLAFLLLAPACTIHAQAPSANDNAQTQQRIEAISAALAATQKQLEQSQQQMLELQQQLQQLRQQMAATTPPPTSPPASSTSAIPLEERVQTLEAAVKLHDQTKVESSSKYPVRFNGLILFNSYVNRGVPDNTDLPAVATRQTTTSGNGSIGASLRQTILGIRSEGPRIAGAHTFASVDFDFFSSVSYTNYGTSAGVVRMRTANIGFEWPADSIDVGLVAPLISPLSPTSYATVAEPSLASAGNLWTWAPQLRVAHRQQLANGNHIGYEFGLWDSPSAGYNPNQLFRTASPAELAGQPAFETRLSYGTGPGDGNERGLQLGLGGYFSRQAYPGYQGYVGTEHIDAYAVTTDFRLPFSHRFELTGEGYRGRSIGGLGGGVYKDTVVGTDPVTGAPSFRPLNAIGGWTQFKTRFTSSLEANASIGQDNGFAGDFHALVLPPTASAGQLRARNRMAVANFIYRPKTYLILSPEYRHIWTYSINAPSNTLDVFTLSIGYQF